jgi:hypothetical protein
MTRSELPVDELQDTLVRIAHSDPVEFVGKQRDALLWHGLLVHNVSMNALSTPRVAIFGRRGHKLDAKDPLWPFGME